MDEDDNSEYDELIAKSRELAAQGKVRQALDLCKQAYKILPGDKLKRKINKMEAFIAQNDSDESEEESGMVPCGDGFFLHKDLIDKLYAHQRQGILWLWGLHRKRKGGILGDDMGLGKTIQIIAFLSGLFDLRSIKTALLVMPLSVITNWEREFEKWAPGIHVALFHGAKKDRQKVLKQFMKRSGVCLSSYGTVSTSWEDLSKKDGREFVWDYVILDEGHKIKNTNKTSKSLHAVPAKHRIILTGTPVQNNLKELWSLFDFVHWGRLLGTQKTFKMEYETPIANGREKDASAAQKRLGLEMSASLKEIIAPYFLARTKAQVRAREKNNDGNSLQMPSLSRKNDLVVWMYLSETQIKIYHDFNSLGSVKELLMSTNKSPLMALTVLKKICDHPRLLSKMACRELGLYSSHLNEDENDSSWNQVENIPADILIKESGKLRFLVELLEHLRENGNRCLVFSQSRKMLDIVHKVLGTKGFKQMRLDGTVKHLHEREELVQRFQNDSSVNVFLLTTQVGGVGLTLTGADRVVIFDPSWNPATDAQAVDRAFRIGQNKNVVIYRLISCGSVEEKIYRRQIFKDSITKQTTGTGGNDPFRYFTRTELRELFAIDDPYHSSTQRLLEEMHSQHRLTDPELDSHLAHLHGIGIFGLSDHDLMFSKEIKDQEMTGLDANDIQARVRRAQDLIALESQQASSQPNTRPMDWVQPPTRRPRDEPEPYTATQPYDVDNRPDDYRGRPKPTERVEIVVPDDTDHLSVSMDEMKLENELRKQVLGKIKTDPYIKLENELRKEVVGKIKTDPYSKLEKECRKEVITIDSDEGTHQTSVRPRDDVINDDDDVVSDDDDSVTTDVGEIKTEVTSDSDDDALPPLSSLQMGRLPKTSPILQTVKSETIVGDSPIMRSKKRLSRADSDSPSTIQPRKRRTRIIESDSEEETVIDDDDVIEEGDDSERKQNGDVKTIVEKRSPRRNGTNSMNGGGDSESVNGQDDDQVRMTPQKSLSNGAESKLNKLVEEALTPNSSKAHTPRSARRTPKSKTPRRTPKSTPQQREMMEAVTPVKTIVLDSAVIGKKVNTPSKTEMEWLVDNSDEEAECLAELSAIMIDEDDDQEVVEESFRTGSRNLFESSGGVTDSPSSRNTSRFDTRSTSPLQTIESIPEENDESFPEEKDESFPEEKDKSFPEEKVESIPEEKDESIPEENEFHDCEDTVTNTTSKTVNDQNHNVVPAGDESLVSEDGRQHSEQEEVHNASVADSVDAESDEEAEEEEQEEEGTEEEDEEGTEEEDEEGTEEEDEEGTEEEGTEEDDEEEYDEEEDDEDEEESEEDEEQKKITAYKKRAKELCDSRDYIRAYKYAYAAYKLAPDDKKLGALLQALETRIKKQQS